MTITHTSPVHITAQIEQDPRWYIAKLHSGFRIGAPDQETCSTITKSMCQTWPLVDILEVTMPEEPDNHFYYLIRDATQEELAKGNYIITLKTEVTEERHSSSWVGKKIFLGCSDGYSYTEALEDAEEELRTMIAHPEQYPELIPPPFQVFGSLI